MSTYKVTCGFHFKNAKTPAQTVAEIDTALSGHTIHEVSVDFDGLDGGMKAYSANVVAQFTGDSVTAVAATAQGIFEDIGITNEVFYVSVETTAALPSHTHTKSEITDFPTLATVATSGLSADLTDIASEVTEAGTTAVTSAGIYAAIHA